MNYSFDKLLEISHPAYFDIYVCQTGEQFVAIEQNTETVIMGPDPITALERLMVSLKITHGVSLVSDAELFDNMQLDLPIE